MKKEVHNSYTGRTHQNNRRNPTKKENNFFFLAPNAVLRSSPLALQTKARVLLQNMAWQRLWFPGLKIKPQFALCASFLLFHHTLQFQYCYLLIDCPVRRIPAQRGKHFLVFSFSIGVWRRLEREGWHYGVPQSTLTLVRLMVLPPLGRNAFVKKGGGKVTYHWLERGWASNSAMVWWICLFYCSLCNINELRTSRWREED